MYNWLRERLNNLNQSLPRSKKSLIAAFLLTFIITISFATVAATLIGALSPEYYSVISLNKKKRYLIEKGDNMVGKGIPNSRIRITIGNKKHRDVFYTKTNAKGEWFYKLPNSLKSGKYSSRIENLDTKSVKAFSKTYRVRLASSKGVYKFQSFLKNTFKFGGMTAFAQDEEGASGETPFDEPTPITDFTPDPAVGAQPGERGYCESGYRFIGSDQGDNAADDSQWVVDESCGQGVPIAPIADSTPDSDAQPGERGYCESGYRFIGSDQGDNAADDSQWVVDESCGQGVPVEAVPIVPYNMSITDVGFVSGGDVLVPGNVFAPTVVVSDQYNQYVTDDSQMNVEWEIVSQDLTQRFTVAKEYECSGLQVCYLRVPQELGEGEYFLQSYLYTPEWGEAIQGVPVAVSVRNEIAAQPYEPLSSDDSEVAYENGPCMGSVCSAQYNAKVVPMDNLYMQDPQFDTSDGSAYNMAADCLNDCSMPARTVSSRYSQNEVDMGSIEPFLSSQESAQSLHQCLSESKSNPSSSLSYISALASLYDSYFGTGYNGNTHTQLTRDFFGQNLISCSLYDGGVNTQGYNDLFGKFNSVEYKSGVGFDDLEGYYRSTGLPVVTETRYVDSSAHYMLILGISDNYVWAIDPLDPEPGFYALRFSKTAFIESVYNGAYWQITPQEEQLFARIPTGGDLDFDFAPGDAAPEGAPEFAPNGYLAVAEIFQNKHNAAGVEVFKRIPWGNLSGESKIISSHDDRFYIDGNSKGYFYTGYLKSDGFYYDIPMGQVSVVEGNFINYIPRESLRENWVGVRVNRIFSHYDTAANESFTADLNKFGIGRLRIALNGGETHEVENVRSLLEIAAHNNYNVLILYNPSSRPSKDEMNSHLGYLFSVLSEVGLPLSKVAFELGNEPDLCQYWKDFEITGFTARATTSKSSVQAQIDKAWEDPAKQTCEVYGSFAKFEWRMAAFAQFIKDSSEVIWSFDPGIKLIVGAQSIQGGVVDPERKETADALKIISGYVDFKKFDFAIHGYQTWNDTGALGTVYEIYKDILKNYKSGQSDYIWITEVGIDIRDLKPDDWVGMLEAIKAAKYNDGLINAVIIHEFDGQTEGDNTELWQLRDNGSGQKRPSYNILQFYLTQFLH